MLSPGTESGGVRSIDHPARSDWQVYPRKPKIDELTGSFTTGTDRVKMVVVTVGSGHKLPDRSTDDL